MFVSMLAAIALQSVPVTEFPWFVRDDWTCKHQPQVAWCNNEVGGSVEPTKLMVNKAERKARRTFSLSQMTLGDGPDNPWMSYAEQVDKPWADDCTGMASTVIDMLSRQGVSKAKLYRALVSTRFRGGPDHMVGLVEVDGKLWVVGDTLKNDPWEYDDAKYVYTFKYISRVSDGTKWGVPVK